MKAIFQVVKTAALPWLAAGCILCLLAGAVFWLYDLPFEPLLMLWMIMGIYILAMALHACAHYARSLQALRFQHLEQAGQYVPARPYVQALEEALMKIRQLEMEARGIQDTYLDYFSLWAHQIKIPLAAMKLELGCRPSSHAMLQEQTARMEQYVDMATAYVRLESDTSDYRLEYLDLSRIVSAAIRTFAPVLIAHKVHLETKTENARVLSDAKWLQFVLEQLLSNAIKYAPPTNPSIEICFDSSTQRLHVLDNGCGIACHDLPRVFEKGFTGYNGHVLGSASSGLGLYLCKRVLSGLGHSIEMQNRPVQGVDAAITFAAPEILGE